MIIRKGERTYTVNECANKWTVKAADDRVTLSYDVPKELCPTEDALREYVRHNDLF